MAKPVYLLLNLTGLTYHKMMAVKQKSLIFCFAFFLLAFKDYAQKNRFIYIETEDHQPFFVKNGEKIFNSSGGGYVIIPKLNDSAYFITIGFPQKDLPQQSVTCLLAKFDEGYLLKRTDSAGWGILNLQNLEFQQAQILKPLKEDEIGSIPGDSFSEVLATVVNDPRILKIHVDPSDTLVPDKTVYQTEALILPEWQDIKLSADSVKNSSKLRGDGVFKIKTEKSVDGLKILFADILGGIVDTVDILIPPGNIEIAKTGELVIKGTNCRKIAGQQELKELQQLMSEKRTDSAMIKVALKQFLSTCFMTEQIKELGALFSEEEGKYLFYVSAYPFVADLNNFGSLQEQLKDEYYISRFKIMLAKK